ncbi:hypothetical protein EDB83DRAFT_2531184 [Lactarius deliciosus]|nr:hypothetical protein EDB83DRAFT_2531184 [Lactarius deliciosus]
MFPSRSPSHHLSVPTPLSTQRFPPLPIVTPLPYSCRLTQPSASSYRRSNPLGAFFLGTTPSPSLPTLAIFPPIPLSAQRAYPFFTSPSPSPAPSSSLPLRRLLVLHACVCRLCPLLFSPPLFLPSPLLAISLLSASSHRPSRRSFLFPSQRTFPVLANVSPFPPYHQHPLSLPF